MRKSIKRAAALFAAAVLLVPQSASFAATDGAGELDAAVSAAMKYEKRDDYITAHAYYADACRIAKELCSAGEYDADDYAGLCALRDSLDFSLTLMYVTQSDADGIFCGSDDPSERGASAYKLSVPFGIMTVSDLSYLLPSSAKDVTVLVSLECDGTERKLRAVASGEYDSYLAKNLRDACRIEGRVMISFCPAVNTWRETNTLSASFISAYRHVSELARRYAPSAKMVFTLADIHTTVSAAEKFFPGEKYVDVLGVALAHTYNKKPACDAASALDCRGLYYDPVRSTVLSAAEMRAVAGDLPVIIESASFPWAGKAAVVDADGVPSEELSAYVLERYFALLPTELSGIAAVFYSNKSSSYGITNLRQSALVSDSYAASRTLPFYRDNASSPDGAAVADELARLAQVPESGEIRLAVRVGGAYSTAYPTYVIDGQRSGGAVSDAVSLTDGDHAITVYLRDSGVTAARIDGTITVKNGSVSVAYDSPDFDYNQNGILDFGDTQRILEKYAKVDDRTNGISCDVNGDGKFTMSDVLALMRIISPEYADN